MQDPKMFQNPIQFPEQEQLKCPRCDSSNTKFCYYNNYNLSQPRHFCKNCKRYWTKGGSLRNIPIGGRTRKTPKKKSSSSTPKTHSAVSEGQKVDQEQNLMVDMSGGSFSSVLGTCIEEGLNANGSDLKLMQMGEDQFGENVMENGIYSGDSYMSLQSGDDWDGNSGCSWPDLAI